MYNLPSLTDFNESKKESQIINFIDDLVFKSIQ
jgi:hypothetical protein